MTPDELQHAIATQQVPEDAPALPPPLPLPDTFPAPEKASWVTDSAPMGPPLPAAPAPPPATAPASPAAAALQDDGFKAFLKQRADQMSALAAAQGKAVEARKWADVGNSFVRAGDTVAGRHTDEGALQAKLEATSQPVRDLMAQQEYGQNATKGAAADVGLQGALRSQARSAAEIDPASSVSQRSAAMMVRAGLLKPEDAPSFSADMVETLIKTGSLQQAREQHAAELKLRAQAQTSEDAYRRGELADRAVGRTETSRHNQADENLASGKLSLKPLDPQTIARLESTFEAYKTAKDLKEAQGKTGGLFGAVGGALGLGDAGSYEGQLNSGVAALARADGRGTATAGSELAMKKLAPGAGSTNTTGGQFYDKKMQQYKDTLRSTLATLKASGMGGAEIAKYEQQLREMDSDAGAAGGAGDPQDTEAVAWAKEHPGDPRAAAILKLTGGVP